jgi:hypothetical protein
MSSFTVTNSTNGNSNTLPTTLSPGDTIPLTGYTQVGSSITYTSLVNPTIESTTTGYLQSGTDIGNVYCVYISSQIISNPANSPAGPAPAGIKSGTIPVSNYSTCSIIMCGGGGGGGGGGGTSLPIPVQPGVFGGGAGAAGGDGALVIIDRYPISTINTISYQVPRLATGGIGGNQNVGPSGFNGRPGQAGGACIITFSDANSIRTNGGNGGNGGQGGQRENRQPGRPGTAGTSGTIQSTITYTSYPAPTTTSFVNLNYNDTNRAIVITAPSTQCCQGGAGGPARGAGSGGRAVFVRIYLYP